MCPYYLDGELLMRLRMSSASYLCASPDVNGETRKHSRLISGVLGLVQFSRTTEATETGVSRRRL